MSKITQENFEEMYIDPIEIRQIDKFVCQEMGRQMHRYIKGMSGSKRIMEKFEEVLSTLTIPQKEEAIARYIDLNRKSISAIMLVQPASISSRRISFRTTSTSPTIRLA